MKSLQEEAFLEKTVSDFLVQFNREPILILNADFTIAQVNDAFLKTAGQKRNAVIGNTCYRTIYGYEKPCYEAHPGKSCPMVETLATGESARVIHDRSASKMNLSYANVVSYPIKNANREIVRIIEIWQDITNDFISGLEQRTKTIKADLNKLVHEDRMVSLGKLAASCVHEINNPIQGLLTFCHLIKDTMAADNVRPEDVKQVGKYAALMADELKRCGDIVTGLLSFARETKYEKQPIMLNDIVKSVLDLTRHRMFLQNIALKTLIPSAPVFINGDKNQMQQCLLNLIFNALDAMPEGGQFAIRVKIENKGTQCRIEIQDNGCGITEKDLPHIFDPFYTTKGEGEGTGLGLSIVYGVVKSHDGDIRIQSTSCKGTVFVLTFPTCSSDSKPA